MVKLYFYIFSFFGKKLAFFPTRKSLCAGCLAFLFGVSQLHYCLQRRDWSENKYEVRESENPPSTQINDKRLREPKQTLDLLTYSDTRKRKEGKVLALKTKVLKSDA